MFVDSLHVGDKTGISGEFFETFLPELPQNCDRIMVTLIPGFSVQSPE
jgi:Na+-transporting NADH:ubiquinone oxidoreductase subunit NqrF